MCLRDAAPPRAGENSTGPSSWLPGVNAVRREEAVDAGSAAVTTPPKPAPPPRRDSGFTRVRTLLAVASRVPDACDDTSREVRPSSMALCSKLSSSVFPYFDDAEVPPTLPPSLPPRVVCVTCRRPL